MSKATTKAAASRLFYGDNLQVLREHVADESVDLVYLDPPFNSNATYNVLFKAPGGEASRAQIEAFDDTWHWNETAERAYDEVIHSGNSDAANMLAAMRSFLGENDMMAYLAMMAVRLLELHRVLKPTGSLYLHCDPTASHYLKILLDAVFGKEGFLNDIIWYRSRNPKGSQYGIGRYSPASDSILFYSKSEDYTFLPDRIRRKLSEEEILSKYPYVDEIGRYADGPILRSDSMGPRPNLVYEYGGFTPGPAGWRVSRNLLEEIDKKGNLAWTKTGAPRRKLRVEDDAGDPIGSIWDDIPPLNSQAQERLGYPTQKPLALLERILAASSNEGDVVLDPFCGCGTTVHAAEKLKRRWIGIDVTHLAVGLIRRRLIDAFPYAAFEVLGVPKDIEGARELAAADKHQFQLWALSMVEAQPYKGGKKGADGGVDGYIWFKPDGKTTEKAVVSVKGGANVGVTMIRDLIATIDREKAKIGVFLTLEEPTQPMKTEATAAGFYESPMHGKFARIQILTIADLFDGDRPHVPWVDPSVFKKAKRETTDVQTKFDL
ncbi:MAG: restriction endonuclease [Hyphomicrobiales bacterium]|nr:restriction endonuclease [Hyphomicrobiales bacterium]